MIGPSYGQLRRRGLWRSAVGGKTTAATATGAAAITRTRARPGAPAPSRRISPADAKAPSTLDKHGDRLKTPIIRPVASVRPPPQRASRRATAAAAAAAYGSVAATPIGTPVAHRSAVSSPLLPSACAAASVAANPTGHTRRLRRRRRRRQYPVTRRDQRHGHVADAAGSLRGGHPHPLVAAAHHDRRRQHARAVPRGSGGNEGGFATAPSCECSG